MAKIIKRYHWLAKDDSAERPRRRCGAQEKPPGIFRPRNIPARWSGAVTSHVLFSLWGPPSQNFLESKTELEATEMNSRTAMICIACARISDRDVVDAGRGTK